MWNPIVEDRFGLMKSFSCSITEAIRDDPHIIPDLRSAETLIVASDYSGQHKASGFDTYTFLFANLAVWPEWERARREVRRIHVAEGRRISFKKLGDVVKRRMLPDFLRAANVLPGLCVSVVIDKTLQSMFSETGKLDRSGPEYTAFARYTSDGLEKLLRIVHLTSFFLAGLTRPAQNVIWFTDQDDIAPNTQGVAILTEIWSRVLSHYLQHSLGHVRCGTTESDNGSLEIEDLAAISDLVAGAVTEAVNRYVAEETMPSSRVLIPSPKSISDKSLDILGWASENHWPLRRLVYCLQLVPDTTIINIKRLKLHGTPA